MNEICLHLIFSELLLTIMIKSIMFFNKRIIGPKIRYWFTELKLTSLIWIFKKIRHLINSTKFLSIIFIDHRFAVEISRQKILFILFTNKLNLHLIRIFEYIQLFNIIIKHKSKKKHIISNALSRLKTKCTLNDALNKSIKKELYIFFVDAKETVTINAKKTVMNIFSIVKIFDEFLVKIIKNYKNELFWTKIQNTIIKADQNGTKIFFHEKNNLVYFEDKAFIDFVSQRQLCLSKIVLKNAFHMTHDVSHFEFHKCCEILSSIYYIQNLTQTFKIYIKHCLKC